MATAAVPTSSTVVVPQISLRALSPYLFFTVWIAATALYFVQSGTVLHELVHDARHLLGYPCH